MSSTRYSCQILPNWNFLDRFSKNAQRSNFMESRPADKLFHEDGWTEAGRQTDRHEEAIVAFGSFANAPRMQPSSTWDARLRRRNSRPIHATVPATKKLAVNVSCLESRIGVRQITGCQLLLFMH
jgi:hypothetical protein